MHVATARRVAGPVRCAPQAAAEPQTVIACHGFGRVVLTSREHIIGLEPLDKGLMGMLLRYPYEVRNEHKYFDDIQHVEITKEMLDLARHVVIQKTADFEPEKFEDHYEQALTDLISAKRSGKAIGPKPRPRVDNVVNLMDALRQSITSYASKPKKPRKAAAGQKEMLLPIDGKGGSEKKATKSESILGNVRRPRLRVAYRS
jgi:DNA end-binding protein Ku